MDGKSKLRVVHLAGTAPQVDIWRTQPDYQTPIRVMFPFPYGAESSYLQSDPGTWTVFVTSTTDWNTRLAESGPIPVGERGGEDRRAARQRRRAQVEGAVGSVTTALPDAVVFSDPPSDSLMRRPARRPRLRTPPVRNAPRPGPARPGPGARRADQGALHQARGAHSRSRRRAALHVHLRAEGHHAPVSGADVAHAVFGRAVWRGLQDRARPVGQSASGWMTATSSSIRTCAGATTPRACSAT